MALSLKPEHLKRYKDAGRLILKYGDKDLVRQARLEDDLDEDVVLDGEETPAAKGEQLAADLEKLGPTYVKLGQLLSTRADFMPPAYMEGLSRLQDDVGPFSFEEVEPRSSSAPPCSCRWKPNSRSSAIRASR